MVVLYQFNNTFMTNCWYTSFTVKFYLSSNAIWRLWKKNSFFTDFVDVSSKQENKTSAHVCKTVWLKVFSAPKTDKNLNFWESHYLLFGGPRTM